ncbi:MULTISPECIES: TIGR03792 family protein [unclassified Synechococcus]|uniref:TIGR03792 family protein n=1 Tax=unclassified Synechococcus TaxID=2626047 RepID=UPI0018CE2A78|nr:TIGR03792 family protein [Synechococcus sp. CBW1006]CAK6699802.1 hypothetical protein IFHNHDMJ_02712 [Synechococcus sp. CBW1107]
MGSRRPRVWLLRVLSTIGLLIVLLGSHPQVSIAAFADPEGGYDVAIVEQLRVKVPADGQQAWLEAERGSWEPWLRQQDGFLGRDLFWDQEREEGLLLIRWASREQWKAIAPQEVEAVQEQFEQLARSATGQAAGNPFPLVQEGELQILRP